MNHKHLSRFARTMTLNVGVALAIGLASTVASAQWLPDRNYTEGPGFRVGNLEIHPGIAFRGGYDTNVFRTETGEISSAILALTPHLNIKTLGRQRASQGEDAAGVSSASTLPPLAFHTGLSSTLFYYLEDRAPSNVEFDAEAGLSVLPERVAGFDLNIDYARNTRPFTAYTGGDSARKYATDRIRPSATLRSQSRSGILQGHLTYTPAVTLFEHDVFKYLNSLQHEVSAGAAWKFLPYTALLYDGLLAFVRYSDPDRSNAVVPLTDSDRFQSRLGVSGAVTPTFSLRALAGYAVVVSKLAQFDDKETVVGEASAKYGTQAASAEIGYQRAVQVAALGSWMLQDRGYLKSDFLFARVFALSVGAGVAHVNYGRLLARDGTPLGSDRGTNAPTTKREDIRIDAGVHAEYRATNWLALLADFSALASLTDFRFDVEQATPFPAQFQTYQAFGGVRVHY